MTESLIDDLLELVEKRNSTVEWYDTKINLKKREIEKKIEIVKRLDNVIKEREGFDNYFIDVLKEIRGNKK